MINFKCLKSMRYLTSRATTKEVPWHTAWEAEHCAWGFGSVSQRSATNQRRT